MSIADFHFFPFLPYFYIGILVLLLFFLVFLAQWKKVRDLYIRAAFCLLLILFLLNPRIVNEARQYLPNKLLVVLDRSLSTEIAGRDIVAKKALAHIEKKAAAYSNLETVIIEAGQDPVSLKNQNTSLFSILKESLFSIPLSQVAGTILITDGQVHDVPDILGRFEKIAPFHAILTGKKNEFDKKVTVVEAPKYGILTKDVTVKVKVDLFGKEVKEPILLSVFQDGKLLSQRNVFPATEEEYNFTLTHAGQNVFEFAVDVEDGELTELNNKTAVIINGVRDRLRVLLVSGMPHVGERAWRNLLKSDPAIDLIHFTILRSPMSLNTVPAREMSLIAFPVEELFEEKIRDFDLIIFDKYTAHYGLLNRRYFSNIASFVNEGGAFLMAMGSDKSNQEIFKTDLASILPVKLETEGKDLLSTPYIPSLNDLGKVHPITGGLNFNSLSWGRWFTQIPVQKISGDTLMTGVKENPLLILDKVGKGRVAVLTSDNIWLWAKGVEGGGPYTDLLRRLSHWLMKEPELEEGYIKAEAMGNIIHVGMRDFSSKTETEINMLRPDGKEESVTLHLQKKGWLGANIISGQNGIYKFSKNKKIAFVIVGAASSPEFIDVHTSEEKLKPITKKTKGGMIWYLEHPDFNLKLIDKDARRVSGDNWIGVKDTESYTVSRVETVPFIPIWPRLILLLGALFYVWRSESVEK